MRIHLAFLYTISLIMCSCSKTYNPPHLYKEIKVGQSRNQVEKILVKAVISDISNSDKTAFWYLKSPTIREIDSPYGPGAIKITYDKNDIVLEKEMNTQGKYKRQKIKR